MTSKILNFKNTLTIYLSILILFFIFSGCVFAYDDITTHPGLTDEIVDFYNLSFNDKLTSEEKEWIVQGSIEEDTPPRWINHFYDSINGVGWEAENLGNVSPTTLKLFSKIFLNINTEIVSSKNWVHNEILQLKYANYGGNRTWENAIRKYVNGDKEYAYKTLGHILHLLEDKTVPDHTRNDTHAHEGTILTKDGGSPYEDYSSNYTRKNLKIAQNLKNENKQPMILNSIDEYFDYLANYSNKYFFSEHTIKSEKYENPKILREDEDYGYGKDKNKEYFQLARIKKIYNKEKFTIKTIYSLIDESNNEQVLSSYFSRLSREAVISGAGVIKLFKEEVAEAEKDKSLIKEEPKISWWQKVISPTYGLVIPLYNLITSAYDNAKTFFFSFRSTEQFASIVNIGRQIENIQKDNNQNFQFSNENVQINFSENAVNQIIEEAVIQSSAPISISKQQLLIQLQAQLNDIQNQALAVAEEINNSAKQLNNSSVIFYGRVGGGGGAALTNNQQPTTNDQQQTSFIDTEKIADNFLENSTSTIVLTETTSTFIIKPNHLVISEIMAGAGIGNSNEEFIELYNPTEQAVNLANWSLKRKTSQQATSTKNLVSDFDATSAIAAKSFFLIASRDYNSSTTPDIRYSNNSNPLAYEDDVVVLEDNDGTIIDEVAYDEIIFGKSLERKANASSTIESMTSGADRFLGNRYDTDDSVNDFILRDNPEPQNFQNLPEPRNVPTAPQNFAIEYSSSAMTLNFNWQESQDYNGAISTITYKITDISNNSSTLPEITAILTSASVVIDEIGRDYSFSVQAFDQEGLSSEIATSSISIPSFLSSLYFYKDSSVTSVDYLIESFYDQYPFIPDVYQNGGNTSWKAMIFYLNSEAAKEIYLDPSFSSWYPWSQETKDKILKIKYNTCAGGVGSSNYILILPDIKENCSAWGGLRNTSFSYKNEDKNFAIAAVSSTIDTVFTANDYLTVAYYSFYSSGWWKGLPEVFQLVAVDKTKYYFGQSPIHQPPTGPLNLTAVFNETSLNLIINWEDSVDIDSLDSLIKYELNYHLEDEELDESKWQEVIKSGYQTRDDSGNLSPIIQTGPAIPVLIGDSYKIYLRAKDEFGNYSEIISTNWAYPVFLE